MENVENLHLKEQCLLMHKGSKKVSKARYQKDKLYKLECENYHK